MQTLKVASISLNSKDNSKENIALAISKIGQAAAQGAQWVVLPEIFNYHGPYEGLYQAADDERGDLYARLSAAARLHSVVLFAGTYGERSKDLPPADAQVNRVYNSMYVFDRDGKELARYRKTHLFNLYDPQGKPLYCEGDGFLTGDKLCRLEVDGFRVGLAICYDLRFSGLFEKLVAHDSLDVIVVPAAFTKQTGEAHWHLLCRARAVEYQCYVVAANQVGKHSEDKQSYGHSLICDPWGNILSDTGPEEGLALAPVEKARLNEVRSRLPIIANRRPELYSS